MRKTIICKKCGAELIKGIKKCPQCGKKTKKPTWLIIIAVVVLFIVISAISGSIKDSKSKKVKYSWPSNGVASLLPQPESSYGKINSESEKYFSIDIYDVAVSDFDNYIESCKENGFTVDYSRTSSHYSANDAEGNNLWISYSENIGEMSIQLTALSEATEKSSNTSLEPTEEPEITSDESDASSETKTDSYEDASDVTAAEQSTTENSANTEDREVPLQDTAENNTGAEASDSTGTPTTTENDMTFRAWVDSYEAFMNKYVDFMKEYNNSDGSDLSLLTDYTAIVLEYGKFVEAAGQVNENELSADDYKYYMDAQIRISSKLIEIQ